jgi:hypothetical protein
MKWHHGEALPDPAVGLGQILASVQASEKGAVRPGIFEE